MMIDKQMVEYVAGLSQIKLNEEQSVLMQTELSKILGYIELLKEVDTDGVEPLSHVFSMTNVMRPDVIGEHFKREVLLQNAPEATDEFFAVPKAVEK